MNHAYNIRPYWSRSMKWSKLSKAAEMSSCPSSVSSRLSAAISISDQTRCNGCIAVSVVWFFRYADWNVEEGLFVARYWWNPSNILRNKRQVENGQPDHQHQSATAEQQCKQQSRSAVLWQSCMALVRRICISWSGGVCFWWRFPVWTAECQLFCSSLAVFWLNNVCFLTAVICYCSGYTKCCRVFIIELSGLRISEPQTRGSQFSSHILHLLFSRPYSVRSTVLSKVALMLQCCVCRLSVCLYTEWIVAIRCVLEQKLLDSLWEFVYKKSIGTKVNDLDLVWRSFKVMSTIASRSPLKISEPWEIEAWFQRTTNRKWPTGNQMVKWPMASLDPERSNSWPQYTQSAISRKQLEMLYSNNR